jgi:hypothetical protein
MQLGAPRTNKFSIGAFELRLGAMERAMQLTGAHSVGGVENATIETSINSTNKMAGFPQKVVDNAIVSHTTTVSATLSETSLRNMRVLMGNGIWSYDGINTDVQARVVTPRNIAQGATRLVVKRLEEGTTWSEPPFKPGDIITAYDRGDDSRLCVCRVASMSMFFEQVNDTVRESLGYYETLQALEAAKPAPTNGDAYLVKDLTKPIGLVGYARVANAWVTRNLDRVWWVLRLDTDTPLVLGPSLGKQTVTVNSVSTVQDITATAGSEIYIYRARTAGGGNVDVANYFSASLIRQDRGSLRPVGFHFWKCTLNSGMSWRASPTDWATFELQLSVLEPSSSEYYQGGPLAHLKDIIPSHPSYMLVDVSDNARVNVAFNRVDTDLDVARIKAQTSDTGLDFETSALFLPTGDASDEI